MSAPNLNVLTIATGKKLYLDMAVSLARSFRWWNNDNGIGFYIATDMGDDLPKDVASYTTLISLKANELGKGFSTKLHLDKLAPKGQTLFIDSDCLIYGDLHPVFEKFKGRAVSVIGNYVNSGDWFGDVEAICKAYQISHLPKFNGGVYYVERGDAASQVYQQARRLEASYDEIGFVRLRGRPNDEVLMALSMQLNDQHPIPDDGGMLAEFVTFATGIQSDLLKGKVELFNTPGHKGYQHHWPLTIAKPLIVHFLGHHNQQMPYLKEVSRLKYLFENNSSKTMADLLTTINVSIPANTKSLIKNVFRPLYRSIWGVRSVGPSERIID